MIEPGTKYRIVGVHEDDAFTHSRLYGAVIEVIAMKRYVKEGWGPRGYWYGDAKIIKPALGASYLKPGKPYPFHAVYLRRVKEIDNPK